MGTRVQRLRQLKIVLNYVNRSNREEDDLTIGVLLAYLFDRLGEKTRRLTEVVGEWVEEVRRA
jgi:hypothetical protein